MKNIILTAPITLNMTNLFGKTEKATGKTAAEIFEKNYNSDCLAANLRL